MRLKSVKKDHRSHIRARVSSISTRLFVVKKVKPVRANKIGECFKWLIRLIEMKPDFAATREFVAKNFGHRRKTSPECLPLLR